MFVFTDSEKNESDFPLVMELCCSWNHDLIFYFKLPINYFSCSVQFYFIFFMKSVSNSYVFEVHLKTVKE